MYRFLCEDKSSGQILSYMTGSYRNCHTTSQNDCIIFTFPPPIYEWSSSSSSWQHTVLSLFVCLTFFWSFVFLGLHSQHTEVPRLSVIWELQLPAYTTAAATSDPSRICDLHHSSQQCRILNPRSKARDRTCILMDAGQICFCWAMTGTPVIYVMYRRV